MTDKQIDTLIYCLIEQHSQQYILQGKPINLGTIFHKINTSLEYEPNLAMRETASRMENEELHEVVKNGGTKALEKLLLDGRKDYNEIIIRMKDKIKQNSAWKTKKTT